ncbi:YgaP family membrane protein [Fodinibius salsisoli]|uniref:DUF2892 domain-containing protein n=1 Tax=Fodinibius salsisoli TaxID=2820877 RepID=A0ABT3PN99_9BACT|nr:DUF2892 domain-containing protein [Fodinibius salsisoli]
MKINMGTIDRIIRSILALVMLVLYFTNIVTGTVGIILVMISVIFLLTSMISFCPLYVPFGLSTCKER